MKNLINKNRIFKKSEIVDRYYAIIDGSKTYLTAAQRGQAPFLNSSRDILAAKSNISRTVKQWMLIKPKKLKITRQEAEASLLQLWFLNIQEGISNKDWGTKIREMFPYTKSYSSWMGLSSRVYQNLYWLGKQSTDIRQGDTSNYGYRFGDSDNFYSHYSKYENVGQC